MRVPEGRHDDANLAPHGSFGGDVGGAPGLQQLGLAERAGADGHETLTLTERGRFLGGGVTADLLA